VIALLYAESEQTEKGPHHNHFVQIDEREKSAFFHWYHLFLSTPTGQAILTNIRSIPHDRLNCTDD
jgi:hypothetical protein